MADGFALSDKFLQISVGVRSFFCSLPVPGDHFAISYVGNFSSAAAMCSTVGAPYFAQMDLCACPVM
jgi:hypothetical protein